MPKLIYFIFGLAGILLTMGCNNGQGTAPPAETVKTTNTTLGPLSSYDSMTLGIIPPGDLALGIDSLIWTYSTGELTLQKNGTTQTCAIPSDLLSQLNAFWTQAQICQVTVTYYNAAPVETCNTPNLPALAVAPFTVVTGGSLGPVFIYIQDLGPPGGCGYAGAEPGNYDYFCSDTDVSQFNSLSAAIWAEVSSLSCH